MAAIVQAQCAVRIAPAASSKATGRVSLKAGFSGKAVQAQSVSLSSVRRAERLTVKAADASAPPAAPVKEEKPPWTAPKLDPNTPSPIFGGSTGGLLRKAQVRIEHHEDRVWRCFFFFFFLSNGDCRARGETERCSFFLFLNQARWFRYPAVRLLGDAPERVLGRSDAI